MINPPKVMVIEDNQMHQKVLLHILKRYFTKYVILKSNPKEAFPAMRKKKPDFVITDFEMP